MFAVQMSTRSLLKPIVTFDGEILEIFVDDMSSSGRRVHVGHMRSIELTQVSRGEEPYMLTVHCQYQIVAFEVSEQALPAAQQLVTAVQSAMATVQIWGRG